MRRAGPRGAECDEHYTPVASCAQLCLSKSSCATRLKASAATVLSRGGHVIPQSHKEQHQPVKWSSSTQIKRLFIHHLFTCWGPSLGGDAYNTRELVWRVNPYGSRQ